MGADDGCELVEKAVWIVGEMRQRGAEDWRDVVSGVAGAGGVEGVEALVVIGAEHHAGAPALTGKNPPYPVSGGRR